MTINLQEDKDGCLIANFLYLSPKLPSSLQIKDITKIRKIIRRTIKIKIYKLVLETNFQML